MCDELIASELGTQEYWDDVYKTEIHNFRKHKDVGEVWFGEDIANKITKWLTNKVPKTSHIIDIGCGNGMLLIELFRCGFEHLTGIDYSKDAIVLAKEVAAQCETNIEFNIGDILKDGQRSKAVDIILDKGTYDAISLTNEAKINREKYINNVYNYLVNDGLLIITSCNWTRDELEQQFSSKFLITDTIPTPQFKFGGKVGSVVSSVIFKKILNT